MVSLKNFMNSSKSRDGESRRADSQLARPCIGRPASFILQFFIELTISPHSAFNWARRSRRCNYIWNVSYNICFWWRKKKLGDPDYVQECTSQSRIQGMTLIPKITSKDAEGAVRIFTIASSATRPHGRTIVSVLACMLTGRSIESASQNISLNNIYSECGRYNVSWGCIKRLY